MKYFRSRARCLSSATARMLGVRGSRSVCFNCGRWPASGYSTLRWLPNCAVAYHGRPISSQMQFQWLRYMVQVSNHAKSSRFLIDKTPWISPCLEHIIVSIHVHVVVSRFDEDKSGTFRSRLPYLRPFLSVENLHRGMSGLHQATHTRPTPG